MVCGNNKKVKAALEAKAAAQFWGKGVEVVVKGFVGNMEDYMTAADCIVTKASTVARRRHVRCRGESSAARVKERARLLFGAFKHNTIARAEATRALVRSTSGVCALCGPFFNLHF